MLGYGYLSEEVNVDRGEKEKFDIVKSKLNKIRKIRK